ncbi:DUF6541 family protein [Georgenia ruanii]|uniref:DUF6541 family protein n=1 Tax=Georgenia ruanii TaxID=348442 RepID=UPI001264D8ED|nr:DUF6541 family protein [Georgenia ruanii]
MAAADIAGTLAVATLLTWLPGLLVLSLARLPRLLVLALAPAVTLFLAYVGTLAARAVGVSWSVAALAVCTAVLMAVVWGLRRWRGLEATRQARWTPSGIVFVTLMVLVAVGIGARAYLVASQNFYVIPQDFDSVFQANAVRWIAEHGDGTASGLTGINNYASTAPFYYPSTLHALMALTYQLAGTGVIAAVHAHILLWMLALPLGAAALVRALGAGPVGAGVAALVSTSFTALPYELIWRGLVPFTETLVLVPAMLAMLALAARRRTAVDAVLLVGAAAGLVGTHTSAATTLMVFGIPMIVGLLLRERRALLPLLRWAALAVVLLAVLLTPTVLDLLHSFDEQDLVWDWPALLTVPEGVKTAVLFGTGYRDTVQLALAVLVWLGVGCAVVFRRYRMGVALAVGMVGAMALYVLAVASDSALSLTLTGFWWNDQLRLSALVAIAAPALVGLFGDAVGSLAGRGALRFARGVSVAGRRPVMAVVASVLGAAVLVAGYLALTRDGYFVRSRDAMLYRYALGPTVTENERAGIAELPGIVPPGSRVMNDYRDGSALMYALSGVRPVFGHMMPDRKSPDQLLLDQHFDELATNPEVARVARELDVDYVWISEGFLEPGAVRAPGVDQVPDQPHLFEKVYENPGAVLYKIAWDTVPKG